MRRPEEQQVPAAPVRLQPDASVSVHLRQGLLRRGSHRLRHEGPGDSPADPPDQGSRAGRQRSLRVMI